MVGEVGWGDVVEVFFIDGEEEFDGQGALSGRGIAQKVNDVPMISARLYDKRSGRGRESEGVAEGGSPLRIGESGGISKADAVFVKFATVVQESGGFTRVGDITAG